jgi:hypothetical protein
MKNFTRAAFASGYLLFPRETTLFAQRLNLRSWQPEGEPLAVAEEIAENPKNGRAAFAASENGVLVFRGNGGSFASQFAWYDRQGKRIGAVGEKVESHGFGLSPDEKRATVVVHEKAFKDDVWIMDNATGVLSRATFDGRGIPEGPGHRTRQESA